MLTDNLSRPIIPESSRSQSSGYDKRSLSTYASSGRLSAISRPIRLPNLMVTQPTQPPDIDIALHDLSSSSASTSSFKVQLQPPPERARRKPVTIHAVARASESESSSSVSPSRSPSQYDPRGARPRELSMGPGIFSPAEEEIGSKWVTVPNDLEDCGGSHSRSVSLTLTDFPVSNLGNGSHHVI